MPDAADNAAARASAAAEDWHLRGGEQDVRADGIWRRLRGDDSEAHQLRPCLHVHRLRQRDEELVSNRDAYTAHVAH